MQSYYFPAQKCLRLELGPFAHFPEQEFLQRYERRARDGRLFSRLEITDQGFMLGAGSVLAKMGTDERGRPCLVLDDEPRVNALLAASLGRPPEAYGLEKMRRAAELWNAGEKALAHIHLAFARLPRAKAKSMRCFCSLPRSASTRAWPLPR